MSRRRLKRRGRRAPLATMVRVAYPHAPESMKRLAAGVMARIARLAVEGKHGGATGLLRATAATHVTFDALLERMGAHGLLVGPVACRRWCSWCCHVKVVASIPEVLLIVSTLAETRDEAALGELAERLEHVHRVAGGLPPALRPRVPCPFLSPLEGALDSPCTRSECSIHPVRPIACRAAVSMDVNDCIADLRDPDAGVPILGDATRQLLGEAFSHALMLGSGGSGMVDLHAAVRLVLSDPGVVDAWLSGQPSFDAVLVRPGDLVATLATDEQH